jgi:hypothetical protein
MAEHVKGYRNPGDIEIKTLKFVSIAGQIIDIGPIVVEMNIFQNLFEHYLQCEIVLNDSLGIIQTLGNGRSDENGGFTGGELLFISYRTKDEALPLRTHFFALYEMSERVRVEEKSETYVMSGVSIEAYLSASKKISKAYGTGGGNTIDKMMKSVIEEYVYNKNAKDIYDGYRAILNYKYEKKNTFDPTNGQHKFIMPNISVDSTIKFLCDQADNDLHIPYFLFYENSDGYNFRDLNELVKQDVKETYTYFPSNFAEGEKSAASEFSDTTNIISYTVLKQTNILTNAKNGLYKSKMINIDLLKKNKKEVTFDYLKNHTKFNKLQPYKVPGGVEGDPVVYMLTSRSDHNQSGSIFQKENHLPKKINQFLLQKKAYERHVFNSVLEVSIPGDSQLQVGDTVYLSIMPATNTKDQEGLEDKYLSGKYIITKLRHKMKGKTGDGFMTIFECAKDTRIQ